MFVVNIIFCFIFISPIFVSSLFTDYMTKTVKNQNLPIETHFVTTPDGYILRLYHIPPVINTNETKVIFFMHGLFSASSSYVLYPKYSAGYYFHNHGYDVWFGNGRGNSYSRNHTTLDPEKNEFWDFSWHEIATIDLPSMIDKVLEKTNKTKLHIYGHSQGATTVFAMLAERPEYNEKFSSIHMLASPVILKDTNLAMRIFGRNVFKILEFADENDVHEVLSHEDSTRAMTSLGEICGDLDLASICKNIIEISTGPFSDYSKNLISDVASIGIPAGASVRQVAHYGQCYQSGRFQKYDYGMNENLKRYGHERPPLYNLSNIRTNVHIMYGTNDYIVLESNTPYLISGLKNAKKLREDRMEALNHFDFMAGSQLKRVVKLTHKRIKQFDEK